MKSLQSMFVALFTILLISSCGSTDSEGEQGFEPYRVGTWFVSSPESGDWEGSNNKNKSTVSMSETDVITFTEPDGVSLKIENRPDKEFGMYFIVIDSTLNRDDLIGLDFRVEFGKGNNYFSSSSSMNDIVDGNLYLRFGLSAKCWIELESDNKVRVSFLNDDTNEVFKEYHFMASGYKDVINDIVCNN